MDKLQSWFLNSWCSCVQKGVLLTSTQQFHKEAKPKQPYFLLQIKLGCEEIIIIIDNELSQFKNNLHCNTDLTLIIMNYKGMGVGGQCNQTAQQLDMPGQRVNATSYSINRSTVLQLTETIISFQHHWPILVTSLYDQRENLQ